MRGCLEGSGTLGLSRLPIPAVIAAIAVQAGIAAQLGLRLGARLSERSREAAEKAAGVALAARGVYLVIAQPVREAVRRLGHDRESEAPGLRGRPVRVGSERRRTAEYHGSRVKRRTVTWWV